MLLTSGLPHNPHMNRFKKYFFWQYRMGHENLLYHKTIEQYEIYKYYIMEKKQLLRNADYND